MDFNFASPYGASAVDPAAASSNWIKSFAVDAAKTATAPAQSPVGSIAAVAPAVGGAPGAAPGMSKLAGGLQTAGSAMDILGGLANIYFGFQQQKLAKEGLNFQKGAFNTNLQNSVQSYNTALGDRIRARHFTEGKSDSQTANYLAENKLSTSGV